MNDRETAIKERQKQYPAVPTEILEGFPYPGDKLRYRGNPKHWLKDIVENAERKLRVGEIYTIESIELGRSWCRVTLAETSETEYELSFFDIFSESEQKFVRHL